MNKKIRENLLSKNRNKHMRRQVALGPSCLSCLKPIISCLIYPDCDLRMMRIETSKHVIN